jgi:Lon-like protease
MDTSSHNLPEPPTNPAAERATTRRRLAPGVVTPPQRHLWWSLPLLTIAGLVVAFVLVAAAIPVERWQQAPGSAESVGDRLDLSEAPPPIGEATAGAPVDGEVYFVTSSGSKLSLLDSVLAALDPDVDVLTYEQRFGPRTPAEARRVGFQMMYGSKQVAEYVAFRILGFDATFLPGPPVVNELVCPDERPEQSACDVLEVGDTITAIDDVPTPLLDDVPVAVDGRSAGDLVTVTVRPFRKETTVERTVALIESPQQPGRVIVGFVPADTRTVDLPFQVRIDTASIGGPSAGFAFTLALIEELTAASVTGGLQVAATGTISEDGGIGQIGALRQKAIAVARSGADLFLVPASQPQSEIDAARAAVGDRLEIVAVANILEALTVLEGRGGDLTGLVRDSIVSS